jgi:hypothetical protein
MNNHFAQIVIESVSKSQVEIPEMDRCAGTSFAAVRFAICPVLMTQDWRSQPTLHLPVSKPGRVSEVFQATRVLNYFERGDVIP